MRVLLLTQWFDPEPTFKGLLFARTLREQGHEVKVVTGFPNYPEGKVYPGYRIRLIQREVIDGIRVLRVPLYPNHGTSALRRVLNYVSFAVAAAVYGTLFTKRPDVIYVYHPPLTAGLAAAFIAAAKRAPFVYDIQDLWPDTLGATGMIGSPRLLDMVDKVCRWVYRRAAHIVVLSPGFKKTLIERGVPEAKIDVVYNWCDEGQLRLEVNPAIAKEPGMDGRFNVVFAGTMGKAQALDAVIEAAKLLEDSHPLVQFVFVGGGIEVDNLRSLVQQLGVQNVRFLPRRPMSEIGQVLGLADVLLVHLKDDPLFEITIPSKTQAYLSVGKPVLMAVRGDAAALVTWSGGGVVCEPENPGSIAEAVKRLVELEPEELQSMGERGAQFYRAQLSLEAGTRRFIDIFHHVLARFKPRKKGLDEAGS